MLIKILKYVFLNLNQDTLKNLLSLMKNFAAHKGMTLIEVLIVVSVIITISTAMFLSSTQVSGTADAAKITVDGYGFRLLL